MKKISKSLAISIALVASSSPLLSASVAIQNLNEAETDGYALFDSEGNLLPSSLDGNIRIGFFNDAFNANSAWTAGDLAALNANFNQFGSAFGIFAGFDGAFQDGATSTDSAFSSQEIVLWVSNSESFTDSSSEHLIVAFDSIVFPADEINGSESVILGIDPSSFIGSGGGLAGEFGNYSHDFGLGSGSLPGFNTVSVVPEPSTYAAIAGILALSWVMIRRRQ